MNPKVPWHEINTVLLDMDGTLLDLHFDNYFWQEFLPKEYSRRNDLPESLSFEKLSKQYGEKKGSLDWYCVDYWSEALKMDLTALKHQHKHLIAFRPHCQSFLEFLESQNKQAVLVTNAHRKSLDIKMSVCSLENWISEFHSSHDLKLAKEHPMFWKNFQDIYPFDPSKSLLIDDNDSVLKSAEDFGIKYLRSIKWPDSKQTEANQSDFPLIDSFLDIIE